MHSYGLTVKSEKNTFIFGCHVLYIFTFPTCSFLYEMLCRCVRLMDGLEHPTVKGPVYGNLRSCPDSNQLCRVMGCVEGEKDRESHQGLIHTHTSCDQFLYSSQIVWTLPAYENSDLTSFQWYNNFKKFRPPPTLPTWILGFCELMSALDSSGKFLRSRMNGSVSSSGSGGGRTPWWRCWDQRGLDLWDEGLEGRVWSRFSCCSSWRVWWSSPWLCFAITWEQIKTFF